MKRLTLAAAGAAVAGLTACTHPAVHPAASSSHSSPAAAPASTPSPTRSVTLADCRQQYATWDQGPGKGLIAALNAVSSAGAAGNTNTLKTVLKQTEPVLAKAARYPVPSCADPKGYWEVLLMHVNAAAASTSAASSLQAAMNGVPAITHELSAELQRTSG